jgi:type III secretion protein SpaR/YscT/HrcT
MHDSYLTIFLSSALAAQNVAGPLVLLFLFLARMLPIIALSPFFGSRVLPHPVKVTFAISLFAVFLPLLLNVTTTKLEFDHMIYALFIKEIFIGFLIGTFVSIPFIVVQTSGMLIDHQRGGASLMVNDPTIQNQSSPLGTLFNFVLIYVFFMIDGPFLFLDAIMKSYEIVPPDGFINPYFFTQTSSFWSSAIQLLTKVTRIAAQLAAPGLIIILMTDVFLGIANRLAPQVQVTFLGLPLKSLLALAVITLGWKAFVDQMIFESRSWLNYINDLILMFKPPLVS